MTEIKFETGTPIEAPGILAIVAKAVIQLREAEADSEDL